MAEARSAIKLLTDAFELRKGLKVYSQTDALRIFHGPGEGAGLFNSISIEKFDTHYWVTEWESANEPRPDLLPVEVFLKSIGAKSAVHLFRPAKKSPEFPRVLFGNPPSGDLVIQEHGCKFTIRFHETRHPGLFLDHEPLRAWLLKHSKGRKCINTFSYTGSLSVACALGGAKEVTTLDLSKPTLEWARKNLEINQASPEQSEIVHGDTFIQMKRFLKEKRVFDLIILDPPSFSRTKEDTFSTAKDLTRLHKAAFSVLSPRGVLVTSINSANIPERKFWSDVEKAAQQTNRKMKIVQKIGLPQSFPSDDYLKGWILEIS